MAQNTLTQMVQRYTKDTEATTLEVVPVGKRIDIVVMEDGTAAFRTMVNRTEMAVEMAGRCKAVVVLESVEQEYFFRYSGVPDHCIFAVCEVVHHCPDRTPSGRTHCPRRSTSCLIGAFLTILRQSGV